MAKHLDQGPTRMLALSHVANKLLFIHIIAPQKQMSGAKINYVIWNIIKWFQFYLFINIQPVTM